MLGLAAERVVWPIGRVDSSFSTQRRICRSQYFIGLKAERVCRISLSLTYCIPIILHAIFGDVAAVPFLSIYRIRATIRLLKWLHTYL